MPAPVSIYRQNYSRSVNVIGEFNDDLAADVLPEILRLRHESNDPITIFIHSPGGQINTLEGIDRALQAAYYGVRSPRIITVAVGDVSSAAASLLALGDYAIAYPKNEIWFHGVRVGEVQVTVEGAQNMAGRLARLNRKIAQRISFQILPRVMFRFLQLKPTLKKSGKLKPDECVPLFEKALAARVGSAARLILRRTCHKVEGASSLSNKIVPKIKFSKTFKARIDDPKILRAVLKHELENVKSPDWELDEAGVQQLADDYLMLRSFHASQTEDAYFATIRDYGPDFLSPTQAEKFKTLKQASDEKAMRFLYGISAPYIAHIWYFIITLSSNLFVGENQISSLDAYWLGLIDEIMGLKLKCERSVMEDKNKNKPPVPPPQTPPQPPAAAAP